MAYRNPILDDDELDDPVGDLLSPASEGSDTPEALQGLADEEKPSPRMVDLANAESPNPNLDDLDDGEGPGVVSIPAAQSQKLATPAQDRYNATLARAPEVYQRQKPSLLRRIGAAATGAAAGWYNANPHERPIDPSGTIDKILYPGQARKEAQFGVELGTAGKAAEAERAQQTAEARNAELGARSQAETARGDYYKKIGDARVRAVLQKEKTPLEKYTDLMGIPGMTTDRAISLATTGKEPAVAKAPTGLTQVTPALGEKLGLQPNEKGEYWAPSSAIGANLKVENPPDKSFTDAQLKARAGGAKTGNPTVDAMTPAQARSGLRAGLKDDESGGAKPMSTQQKLNIETRKQQALQKAQLDAEHRIRGDRTRGIMPEDPEQVRSELAQEQDRIQSAYEAEIAAVTGGEIPHNNWANQQRPAAPRGGGRGQQQARPSLDQIFKR